jgi:phospholipid-binding lipoprotein MlaA
MRFFATWRSWRRWGRWPLVLLICFWIALPAAAQGADPFDDLDGEFEAQRPVIADPLRPWNRAMFEFNDRLYFWLLKPVAEVYRDVVPEPPRIGIRNFFNNLGAPLRFVACLLQGKSDEAGAELGAFMVNTTVGFLGFGNPAAGESRLNVPKEDLGQAFGVWGMGHGCYIVWPVLGPSSLRDSVGLLGGHFLDPFTHVDPSEVSLVASGLEAVNTTSLHIGDYEALKKEAVAPYEAMRDAYVQFRQRQVER